MIESAPRQKDASVVGEFQKTANDKNGRDALVTIPHFNSWDA